MQSNQAKKNYYSLGLELLAVVVGLEDDFKHNYENGSTQEKALATIGLLQNDLLASYLSLLQEDEKGPLVGRVVILRTLLENQGAILHIKGNEKRAKAYLHHVKNIHQQVIDQIEGRSTPEKDRVWSSATITHRVGLIDSSAVRLYNTLSNFTHGNNMLYYLDTKEITDAFIRAVDSYFIGLFIGYLAELGIGLDLSDKKRTLIFSAIESVGKQGINKDYH